MAKRETWNGSCDICKKAKIHTPVTQVQWESLIDEFGDEWGPIGPTEDGCLCRKHIELISTFSDKLSNQLMRDNGSLTPKPPEEEANGQADKMAKKRRAVLDSSPLLILDFAHQLGIVDFDKVLAFKKDLSQAESDFGTIQKMITRGFEYICDNYLNKNRNVGDGVKTLLTGFGITFDEVSNEISKNGIRRTNQRYNITAIGGGFTSHLYRLPDEALRFTVELKDGGKKSTQFCKKKVDGYGLLAAEKLLESHQTDFIKQLKSA